MSQFKTVRPQQDVRLKEWSPGRVSQMKLFISHLETSVNTALAAQVSQNPRKKFSQFVPKVPAQDITGQVEFREIRFSFEVPRGLKRFLLYEYQLSESENFANFTPFESTEPVFVFGGLQDSATYYMRVRVLTTNGNVGPWSDVFTATTPVAKANSVFENATTGVQIVSGESFETVLTKTFDTIGGKTYYSVQYEVTQFNPSAVELRWCDVEFRWLEDGQQNGQNSLVTVYSTTHAEGLKVYCDNLGSTTPGDFLSAPGSFKTIRAGTFIQKLTEFTEGQHTVTLEARVLPASAHRTPNDFRFDAYTSAPSITYGATASVELKNFNLFEVVDDLS